MLLAQEEPKLILSEDEWKRLKAIVKILRHPYNVTQLLQQTNFTLSDFYAAWLELKFTLRNICELNSNEDLAQCILDAMDEKKNEQLIRNPSLRCSVFLDPRLKNLLVCDRERHLLASLHLSKLFHRFTQKNNTELAFSENLDDSDEKITSFSNLSQHMSALDCSLAAPVCIDNKKNKAVGISQLLDDFAKTKSVAMSVPVKKTNINVQNCMSSQKLFIPLQRQK